MVTNTTGIGRVAKQQQHYYPFLLSLFGLLYYYCFSTHCNDVNHSHNQSGTQQSGGSFFPKNSFCFVVVYGLVPRIGKRVNYRDKGTSRIGNFPIVSSKNTLLSSSSSSLTLSVLPGRSTTRTTISIKTTALHSTSSSTTSGNTIMSCKRSTQQSMMGKTVLLTGASGGLGRALALQCAQCGVARLILSARSVEKLQPVMEECGLINPQLVVHAIACDLADPVAVDRLATEALQWVDTTATATPPPGRVGAAAIDILINNGGVSSRSRFLDTHSDIDRQIMQVNFLSGAALAKLLVPAMIARQSKGWIIWISSVQGLVGIPLRSSYAASKFAVQGYCESIRSELMTSGISVHCVSPGYIRTNLSQSALQGDGTTYGRMDTTTEQGADPQDVARIILDKVMAGQTDFAVAATPSALAAIWLRLLCPSLLRYLLVQRYEKSQRQSAMSAVEAEKRKVE